MFQSVFQSHPSLERRTHKVCNTVISYFEVFLNALNIKWWVNVRVMFLKLATDETSQNFLFQKSRSTKH